MPSLSSTNFQLPGQTAFYRGKVRDVYTIDDRLIAVVATDRISAFDVILPKAIPYKGQVLNQVAAHFLKATKDIVPNWLIDTPDPCVSIGRKCDTIPLEMVVRGYAAGHAWRTYRDGKRVLCGVAMPDGLREYDPFPAPIITPTTKAQEGHDEDISAEDAIKSGVVTEAEWEIMSQYALALYQRGNAMAAERGLILMDTKYEFGKTADGQIILIDEIHTPDSSRYIYLDGYEERQAAGQAQRQLSKEFVREWLIENGFQGKEGQVVPEMTVDFVRSISERYIELFEQVTGSLFTAANSENPEERILNNILKWFT